MWQPTVIAFQDSSLEGHYVIVVLSAAEERREGEVSATVSRQQVTIDRSRQRLEAAAASTRLEFSTHTFPGTHKMRHFILQSSSEAAAGWAVRGAATAGSGSRGAVVVPRRACNPGSSSRSISPAASPKPWSSHPLHHGAAAAVTAAAAIAAAPTSSSRSQQHRRCRCSSSSSSSSSEQAQPAQPAPLVVVEGDIVTFHMTCRRKDGTVLESSLEAGEPLSFEIGAGDVMGNPLYQAFDGSLRGLGVDDSIELEISGGEWKQELLFTVPRDHPEIERLEGRYKNQGGLAPDLAVELANGSMAVVVEVTPEHVRLDANSMMSGKTLLFELEVLSIDRPPAA